jgi:Spy/CpxP family protein refolding chaperone
MSKTRKGVGWVLGSALVIAVIGTGVHAQAPAGPAAGGLGRRGGPMARGGPMGPGAVLDLPLPQLNLTDQQRDQVKTILDSHQDELKMLGDREASARQALERSVAADAIDEGAIRQHAADLGAVQADMAVERAHIRAEVMQILTPDQQKQAKAIEANRPGPPGGRGRGRR